MFFLKALFQGNNTLDFKERMHLKMRLEAERRYYSEKINFLTSKKKSPQLAMLTCRDAQVAHKDLSNTAGRNKYLRNCNKFYQKKLSMINLKLKKI